MQAIVSGNCMTHVKLCLINTILEKSLIVGKLICLIAMMSVSASYLDSYDTKALSASIKATGETYSASQTDDGLASMVARLMAVGQIIDDYNFDLASVSFQQFVINQNASECTSIDCLAIYRANGSLYESRIVPVSASSCKQADCKEFEAVANNGSQNRLSFLGSAPSVYFDLTLFSQNLSSLGTLTSDLVDNGWLTSNCQQLTIDLVVRKRADTALSCIVSGHSLFNDRLRTTYGLTVDCFVVSDTELVFAILMAIIVAISIAKPMIESSVASTKWIYFVSLYTKLFWFVWTVLKISGYMTAKRVMSSSELSRGRVDSALAQKYLASILLFVLSVTVPFECLKLFKRPSSYGAFSQLMSTLYGATLSVLSYLIIALIGYVFLCIAAYLCIGDYNRLNMLTFMFTFVTQTDDLSEAPSIIKAFYCLALVLRYLLWAYLLAVFIFYFKLVSTHTFSAFEPKFYKSILDKVSTIHKAIDNFSNDTLLKPIATSKSKRHQVIIWLNYGFQDSSGQRLYYSDAILNIFGEVERVGIGLSFFNEFREVISFLKCIYNIIPKIIMSTNKSVRIVVRVCNIANLSRTEFELKVFTKMNELNQFISDMGLDIEILLYDEQVGNVYGSRVYSILENSFSKIKVTSNREALRRFCQMMSIDDFAADADEVFNALLDDIDEQI